MSLRDFVYASRSLRKNAGFTAAAIATLALGIGANTAIFSVLQGVMLDPLPYGHPDRLVLVALYNRTLGYATDTSYPDFLDWRRSSRSFEQIAAFANEGFDLSSPGTPEHLDGMQVSSNFFNTLNVSPALGRSLSPKEDEPNGPPAAVIGDRLWRERFGSSPAALGTTITLNGVDHTIVGVLAPGFRFGDQSADVYTPIARRNTLYIGDRTVHDILCIARLKPDVSIGQALAELNTVQDHIDELNPATERGEGVEVIALKRFFVGDIGETLMLLLGAVGLVLLIACANVANLLLARSAARTREFAIRLAVGASRAQIVRQVLAESITLSLAGGLLGLAIAKWGVDAILVAAPGHLIPRMENIGVNTPVLLFAFAVSTLVGIVFGLVPALNSARTDVQDGLKEGGRTIVQGHQRTQHVLVVLQVAVALVLLAGGSLLFRTIHNLWAVNPGFSPRHVLTFQVGLSRTVTPLKMRIAYQRLLQRIRQVPGVEAADVTALVPLGGGHNEGPFWKGTQQPASMAEIPRAVWYPTGPDYVKTMGIPLLSGRYLSLADDVKSPIAVLVDSLLARRYFPHENAVGQTITIPHWGAVLNVPATIVGVLGHVDHYGLDGSTGEKPQIYFSLYQLPDETLTVFRSEVTVAIRTRLDTAIIPAIAKAVHDAGSDQPVYNLRTMQELVYGSMGRQRFPMLVLIAFAILALALAFVGIYAVISYWTTRRVNEIGIRMALGAVKRDVLLMVVGQGLRLAVVGVAIGTVAAVVSMRVFSTFSHLLYGVQATDPVMLVSISLLLLCAAAVACYLPARRAAMLDPTVALRQE